jgi:TolB protein
MSERPQTNKVSTFGLAAIGCGLFVCGLLLGVILWIALPGLIAAQKPTPIPLVFPTRTPQLTALPGALVTESASAPEADRPTGKIVYVCQIFQVNTKDQICIINADGTGQARLTTNDNARHFYPSLAPDGKSVLFSSNMDGNFEIYELTLAGQLTRFYQPGIAPEVSPDNRYIAFTMNDGARDSVWIMDRNGGNPRQVVSNAWDPTWSPDGSRILYASFVQPELVQLTTINLDGSDPRQITDLPLLRGRSDWSDDNRYIVTYSGKPWERELYIMNVDGSSPRQLTPSGGNSQGPSFSPDGKWVTFTAYFDKIGNNNGCEIFIMKIDGTNLTRLTDNKYCDWQPRWGQ